MDAICFFFSRKKRFDSDPGYIQRLCNNPPEKHKDDDIAFTIGPGLDAPELVKELCLGGTLQLLYQAPAVRRNLKFVFFSFSFFEGTGKEH